MNVQTTTTFWKGIHLFLLFSSLFYCSFAQVGEQVVGCGGFVGISPKISQKGKIDYSKIKVNLVTADGLVKESTECAPNNGYYFLPLYDRGNFFLQVEAPSGWNFEPNKVPVSIGDNNQCNSVFRVGEDINFQLAGFTITGNVVSEGCGEGGPVGVEVTLSSNGEIQQQTKTTEGGRYKFDKILVGKYQITASHPSWTLKKSSVEVQMDWGNKIVEEPFVVSGYDVSGKVHSSNEPVLGVHFLLFPEGTATLTCSNTDCPTVSHKGKTPSCCTTSDNTGSFSFKNIPCGSYTLVPVYKGTDSSSTASYDVAPSEAKITVQQGSVIVEPFQVMGFSIIGKVLDEQGKGVAGVQIKLDGKPKTTTDQQGLYKLEQVKLGSYSIEAVKEHYKFSSLSQQKISPNLGSLPDISVKGYDLCGSIRSEGGNSKSRTVNVHKESSSDVLKTGKTDQNGKFCFELEPGNYDIKPVITKEEQSGGFLLTSSSLTISLAGKPILDADFSQASVTIEGRIECLEKPCASQWNVQLEQEGSGRVIQTSQVNSKGEFKFSQVSPGNYLLHPNQPNWCWKQEKQPLKVQEKDISGIILEQTGFSVTIESPHQTELIPKPLTTPLSIPSGTSKHCLPTPGTYSLTPSSCFRYERESYSFDTKNPGTVKLVPTHTLVEGSILSTTKDSSSSFSVEVRRKSDGKSIESQVKTGKDSNELVFQFWSFPGELVEIAPKSTQQLVVPAKREFQVEAKGSCPQRVESFQAKTGTFLSGKVEPAIPGVKITVFDESSTKLVQVETSNDGSYKAGPLYDNQKYELKAEKDGYNFVLENGKFIGSKLGKIRVEIEESGSGLSGVLVSVSGDSYRSTSGTAGGAVEFTNLKAGDYFLRATLKEYQFEPSSKTISLSSGSEETVSFVAKRVAYSCWGSVRTLSGDSEKDLRIEALQIPGNGREETYSDASGNFRIRGLLPNSNYSLRITPDQRITRSSPTSHFVSVENRDTTGVQFIVFRKGSGFDLTGVVDAPSVHLSQIKVLLMKEDAVVEEKQLGPSRFFEFMGVEEGSYKVTLSVGLSKSVYEYTIPEKEVVLNQTTSVNLEFSPRFISEPQDLSSTSFFGLIVGSFVVFALLYNKEFLAYIETLRVRFAAPPPAIQSKKTAKKGK